MGKWMLLIILCMAVFIMYNSPIENENKPLSVDEKTRQRVRTRIIVSGLLIGIIGFSSMNETRFVTSIYFAIAVIGAALFPAVIKSKMKK